MLSIIGEIIRDLFALLIVLLVVVSKMPDDHPLKRILTALSYRIGATLAAGVVAVPIEPIPGPWETCFLIGTKSVNLGIRPSNLAYGTSFARGKTGTALPKRSNLGHLKNVVKERML